MGGDGTKVAPADKGGAVRRGAAAKLGSLEQPAADSSYASHEADEVAGAGNGLQWMLAGMLIFGFVGALLGVVLGLGVALTDWKAMEAAAPADSDALLNVALERTLPLTAGLGALSGVLMGAVGGWSSHHLEGVRVSQ